MCVDIVISAVIEHVDHLAQTAVSAKCQFDLAMKQLAYNKRRQDLVAAYEEMLASARKICATRTEGIFVNNLL